MKIGNTGNDTVFSPHVGLGSPPPSQSDRSFDSEGNLLRDGQSWETVLGEYRGSSQSPASPALPALPARQTGDLLPPDNNMLASWQDRLEQRCETDRWPSPPAFSGSDLDRANRARASASGNPADDVWRTNAGDRFAENPAMDRINDHRDYDPGDYDPGQRSDAPSSSPDANRAEEAAGMTARAVHGACGDDEPNSSAATIDAERRDSANADRDANAAGSAAPAAGTTTGSSTSTAGAGQPGVANTAPATTVGAGHAAHISAAGATPTAATPIGAQGRQGQSHLRSQANQTGADTAAQVVLQRHGLQGKTARQSQNGHAQAGNEIAGEVELGLGRDPGKAGSGVSDLAGMGAQQTASDSATSQTAARPGALAAGVLGRGEIAPSPPNGSASATNSGGGGGGGGLANQLGSESGQRQATNPPDNNPVLTRPEAIMGNPSSGGTTSTATTPVALAARGENNEGIAAPAAVERVFDIAPAASTASKKQTEAVGQTLERALQQLGIGVSANAGTSAGKAGFAETMAKATAAAPSPSLAAAEIENNILPGSSATRVELVLPAAGHEAMRLVITTSGNRVRVLARATTQDSELLLAKVAELRAALRTNGLELRELVSTPSSGTSPDSWQAGQERQPNDLAGGLGAESQQESSRQPERFGEGQQPADVEESSIRTTRASTSSASRPMPAPSGNNRQRLDVVA
ncbi:MAG: hypothetical protein V2A73_01755 [Pseudomonadota bacterium]